MVKKVRAYFLQIQAKNFEMKVSFHETQACVSK